MEHQPRWDHVRRLLAPASLGALAILWSRGPDTVTALAGACGAAACAAAIAVPPGRLPAVARRLLAAIGLATLLGASIARLFPRPGSALALLDAAALAWALLAACAALGGGLAARVLLLVACAALAAAHALLLPRLGADGGLPAEAARAIATAGFADLLAALGHAIRPSFEAAALQALWLAAAQTAFGPAVSEALGVRARGALVRDRRRLALLLAALVAAAPASVALARSRPGRLAREVARALREGGAERAALRRIRGARAAARGGDERPSSMPEEPRSIVVVIGGPSAKHHWSLYGYPRPTNEPLAAWTRDLVLFSDVVAPHSLPVQALEGMLAGAGAVPAAGAKPRDSPDIVSLARSAGYEVSWVSARSGDSARDDLDRLMAERAGRRALVEPSAPGREATDEDLVLALARLLERRRPRSLAFVHLTPSPGTFCPPPPEALGRLDWAEARRIFGRLGGDALSIDCRDRAVARQSVALAGVLALARRHSVDTVLYVAEHGAWPGPPVPPPRGEHAAWQVEIPLFWWLDERFWARHPAEATALRANRDRPVVSSDLFQTFRDLTGSRGRGFAPDRSLLRGEFQSSARLLLGGRLDYDRWSSAGDEWERTRANMRELARRSPGLYARVWAHRVDTLGKLQQAMGLFAGVELDVAWQDGKLFVFHPPADNLGIELRDYLRVAERRPDLGFWFDLKLNGLDDAVIPAALVDLDPSGLLRRRCIAELPPGCEHAALARDLAARGWRVSFQLASGSRPGPRPASTAPAEALRRERDCAAATGYTFLSYDIPERDIASAFMQDPRVRALERLTWDLSLDASAQDFLARVQAFPESVVLVNMPSRYEN